MMIIIMSGIIFLQLLWYAIILDVILSWLAVFGLRLRPKFLAALIEPMYATVKKYIPSTFGPIDFTPIILLFSISFLMGVIISIFPEVQSHISQYM